MNASENARKNRGGRPAVDSEQLNIRLHRSEIDGLDRYAASLPKNAGRTKAARKIICDWLAANGYLNRPAG